MEFTINDKFRDALISCMASLNATTVGSFMDAQACVRTLQQLKPVEAPAAVAEKPVAPEAKAV